MDTAHSFQHGGNSRLLAKAASCAPEDILDFSVNVRPEGPALYLRAAINKALSKLALYPSPHAEEAKEAAALHYKLPAESFVFGNGTAELIYALAKLLVQEQVSEVLLPEPCFTEYEHACRLEGLPLRHLPCELVRKKTCLDWKLPVQDLLSAKSNAAIFLTNPGNPAGTFLPPRKLSLWITNRPDIYWVIDEAFLSYVTDDSYGSLIPHLAKLPDRVIVLRSLTKFEGLAGLRLGFLVAQTELAQKVQEKLPAWNVNCLSLAAAQAVLTEEHREEDTRLRKENRHRRQALCQALVTLPLQLCRSFANYLLFRLNRSDRQLGTRLLTGYGIAIRACDNYHSLEDGRWYRIAVRGEKDQERLLQALSQELCGKSQTNKKQKTPALMFLGTASSAGKSILAAAFCRIFFQDGISVAPFKAQNMSLNSGVTVDGKEMGRAQILQAQAAGLDPDVRMNPILLKPHTQRGSQIILMGKPSGFLNARAFLKAKQELWQPAYEAYHSLASEHELMVLEGAGSPAEINLKQGDIVNMRMALEADAKVLLVGDIDRGGLYASFLGTWLTFSPQECRALKGWIINRFRGDVSLLQPANDYLYTATGIPVIGTIPWIPRLDLPEEDSFFQQNALFHKASRPDAVDIGVVMPQSVSNCTDLTPLSLEPDVTLRVIRSVQDWGKPDLIILPGSKTVASDLADLRKRGLIDCLLGYTGTVFGICGGMQMLGERIEDPQHLESDQNAVQGLGLLPLCTRLVPHKTLSRTRAKTRLGEVEGYEIHHGVTSLLSSKGVDFFQRIPASDDILGLVSGQCWGTYLHGVFDNDSFRRNFLNLLREKAGLKPEKKILVSYNIERSLNHLADIVRRHVDMQAIYRFIGKA